MLEAELHISDLDPKGESRFDDRVGRAVYASPAGQTEQPSPAVPEFPANSSTCEDARVDYQYLGPGSWLGMATLDSVWAHTARQLVAAPVFLVS